MIVPMIAPKILIVEDDISLKPIWFYIIEKVHEKALVVWATSESEAESLIIDAKKAGGGFDLVITDIFLCGSKTGLDLWSRFFDDLNGCIIVTSGVEYNKFVKYFEGSSKQPIYLQKPLMPNECIEVIYGILHRTNKKVVQNSEQKIEQKTETENDSKNEQGLNPEATDIIKKTLLDLEGKIGLDGKLKVMNAFITSLPELRSSLSKHLDEKNLEKIQKIGHRYKISSLVIGAKNLSLLCKELEEEKSFEKASSIVHQILEASQKIEQTLTGP